MNEIKLQDFFYPMLSVSTSGKEGLDLTWQFFQDNFDELKEKLKSASPSLMGAVISCCCGGYCSAAKASEIEAFFEDHPLPQNARKISQMLEGMRTASKFKEVIKGENIAPLLQAAMKQ